MPEMDRILNLIRERAKNFGIDLESMGIYDDEDLQIYALKFVLEHIEDLDGELEVTTDDLDDYLESDEEEGE